MYLLVAGLLIFHFGRAPTTALPCAQVLRVAQYAMEDWSVLKVTSSECSRDGPFVVFEDKLETKEECVSLCKVYADISTYGCTFSAWEDLGVLGNCILYKETFADYLSHCKQISGPPDTSGCSVETPEENSCDIIRYFSILTITRKYFFWIVVTQTINFQTGRVCSARKTYRPHSKSE